MNHSDEFILSLSVNGEVKYKVAEILFLHLSRLDGIVETRGVWNFVVDKSTCSRNQPNHEASGHVINAREAIFHGDREESFMRGEPPTFVSDQEMQDRVGLVKEGRECTARGTPAELCPMPSRSHRFPEISR